MKTIRLFFIIFILCCNHAVSQYFDGGAVLGLSASQVDGDSHNGYNKFGLLCGGWVKRMFSYTAGGQLELRYIMKGSFASENIKDAIYYKLVLHYIDIPLMVNYEYRERVIFELGVSPELLVYHREEDQYGVSPEDAPPFHPITLSGIAGVGYKFLDHFIASARFSYSIVPIREHPSGQTYLLNRGQYNNVLTFSVYYQVSR